MAFTPNDNRLPITLASGVYDITQPLINGLIDVEGINLNVLSDFINVDAIFRRMLRLEFDAAKMSTAHYLVARQRGIPIVAVPVFLNRLFIQSFMYKNKNSGITGPADLVGKRVGVPRHQATRPMWVRGVFEEVWGNFVLFPNMLRQTDVMSTLHWRVPIDDYGTAILQVSLKATPDGSRVKQPEEPPVDYDEPWVNKGGEYHLRTFAFQDGMAWET